jgi:hypothetical protein
VGVVGGVEFVGEQHAYRESGEDDGPEAGVAFGPVLSEEASAFDVDDGAADGERRVGGCQVEVCPAQGEDFADAGAGGEHEVDDVGLVAGVSGSGFAGDGLLPVPDRRPDGVKVLMG